MKRTAYAVTVTLGACHVVFPIEDPPPIGPCTTKARALADSLDTGPRPQWEEFTNQNPISYDGDGVHMQMDAGENTYLRHTRLYDLRESSFEVEVNPDIQLGETDQQVLTLLTIDFNGSGAGEAVEMVRKGNMLFAQYFEDGASMPLNSTPFDPEAHRIWRISRTGEKTRWSTIGSSGEPVTFQEFEFPWTTYLQPELFVSRDPQSVTPFVATFRNFNGGNGAETADVCPAESLIDSFDELDAVTWGRSGSLFEGLCRFGVEGSALVATLEPGGSQDNCSFGSSGVYDLRDHTFTIETDLSLTANERVLLVIETFDESQASFALQGGMLQAVRLPAGGTATTVASDPYDPLLHKFWRFTAEIDDAGLEQLVWETSATGRSGDFQFFAQAGGVTSLDRVRFVIGVLGDGTETADTRIRFPGVNFLDP